MLEEKEVLTDEEIVEESVSEALAEKEMDKGEVDNPQDVKNALVAFILAAVGFFGSAGCIVAIVLGAISLGFLKKIKGTVEKKPHAVFMKIAKPVAIVDIILGAVMTVVYIVLLIVWIVGVIAVAAAAAAEGA